jgi:hypothetical protein
MALERAQGAGEALTRAQDEWLRDYQTSSEYRAHLRMARSFGARE